MGTNISKKLGVNPSITDIFWSPITELYDNNVSEETPTIEFYPNGTPKIVRVFEGPNKKLSIERRYYESGLLESTWELGKKQVSYYDIEHKKKETTIHPIGYIDRELYYHENKEVAVSISYDGSANRNGQYEEKYPDGKLKNQATYENGVIVGFDIDYHPNGNLKRTKFYNKGKLHGEYKEYDEKENIICFKVYDSDKLIDTWPPVYVAAPPTVDDAKKSLEEFINKQIASDPSKYPVLVRK